MSGYTISADVMGKQVRDNLPNMGVTAHRYILQMVGNEQKLRVSAWDAVPRVAKEIDFDWEPDSWYHLKTDSRRQRRPGNGSRQSLEKGRGRAHRMDNPTDRREPESVPDRRASTARRNGIQPPSPGTPIYYDNIMVK